MQKGSVLLAIMAGLLVGSPAQAEVKLSGSFVATRACPATQSIKSAKNPGNIATEVGKTYDLLAGNKDLPTHYLIEVPGAEPDRRWVKVTCGHLADGEATEAPAAVPGKDAGKAAASASGKPEYVLALSWQPAFCETKSSKPECRAQTVQGFDATHFTLHGLWPQPNGNFYCGVKASDRANDKPGRWDRLPAVTLDAATRQELETVMPGTQSALERHEWIKHGTCSGKNQQDFFADAVRLAREVNASPVQALFAKSVGGELTSGQIRDAFDAAFGAGAGNRVRVSCVNDRGRRLIGEVTLGLTGPIEAGSSLSGLMLAAAATDNAGCPKGLVDAVGRQ
ncbi:MAG: ribonuclease [Mesorhizobium sp.]|nr:ribonuclease [Mesorhizobium sp.]MBN9243286.1 ribonuclease [Mesorhizobium sp.]